MKALNDVLNNTAGNYILPFLWMHGEEDSVILEELERIRECGIGAVCLESRPHPDFAGEHWWHDVDLIMDDARRHGTKVWILDDCAFPTGKANGKAALAPDELRRRFIRGRRVDMCGPLNGAAVILREDETPENIVAIAARRFGSDEIIELPLSAVSDGLLYWDIPDGLWRVFVVSDQLYGSIPRMTGYINPLIRESTQILIDAVYEPHYQRYAADFGKTLLGFFSDEPGICTELSYYTTVGTPGLPLPWTPTMEKELSTLTELPLAKFLLCLFDDVEGLSPACRFIYTDHVSKLYRDNFSYVLGDWCRAHGVEYMGHIIEDNNSHGRIGYSAGHYFRSLEGQDFGGIDIVLNQLIPGMDEVGHMDSCGSFPACVGDGEFFTYMLAQLAESQAALEPRKKGRAMCEIFGAFGWSEGCKLMKWMTDFMLVRGINNFVPHAFSPKEFPDPDCPPHFYARGKNPQFYPFTHLMRYMNRVSHLLSGGRAEAPVAILYHADSEWTTRPVMLSQAPARVLTQSQIPFRFVSLDYLREAEPVDGGFVIGGHKFSALVIPCQQTAPSGVAAEAERLRSCADVCFVDALPEKQLDGSGEKAFEGSFDVVPLDKLAERFSAFALETGSFCKQLRARHYLHNDGSVWMLTNEHPYETVSTTVSFPEGSGGVIYDAMDDRILPLTDTLTLAPYESRIVIFGEGLPAPEQVFTPSTSEPLELEWKLSLCKNEDYPAFEPYAEGFRLRNLSCPGELSRFSGILRYEAQFVPKSGRVLLDLGEVYETAEVFVNGEKRGLKLAPPYRFELDELIPGRQTALAIEVRNTLGHEQRDYFSSFMPLEPIGLLGPVTLGF